MNKILILSIIVLVIASYADVVTTSALIRTPDMEFNPICRLAMSHIGILGGLVMVKLISLSVVIISISIINLLAGSKYNPLISYTLSIMSGMLILISATSVTLLLLYR